MSPAERLAEIESELAVCRPALARAEGVYQCAADLAPELQRTIPESCAHLGLALRDLHRCVESARASVRYWEDRKRSMRWQVES